MDTEAEKFGRGLMELGFKTKENLSKVQRFKEAKEKYVELM